MITASTSSRFTAEATPAPSASIARSMSCVASASPRSSARAQTPLVSRVAAALLHDLEQVGLLALARPARARAPPSRRGPRRPPCSRGARTGTARRRRLTTMWPISPGRRRGRATACRRARRRRRRPCPRRRRGASGRAGRRRARTRPSVATLTSLPSATGGPSASLQRAGERERALPARQVARARDRARAVVDVARGADADAGQLGGLDLGAARPRRARASAIAAATSAGPPSVGVGAPRLAEHRVAARRRRPPGSSCRRGRRPRAGSSRH